MTRKFCKIENFTILNFFSSRLDFIKEKIERNKEQEKNKCFKQRLKIKIVLVMRIILFFRDK